MSLSFLQCKRCALHKTRTTVVPYRGIAQACSLLFIGEAPGVSEDVLSRAFCGVSGKLLDRLIERADIPSEVCFFTNTVLCRPCDEKAGPNREPKKEEVFACMPNVEEVIGKVNYVGVVFVGAVAKKYYGAKFPGVPTVDITHPAAILRRGGISSSLFMDNAAKLRRFYDSVA